MKRNEDILNRFYDSFQQMEGQYHILENSVPMEQQLEYFRFAERVRRELKRSKKWHDDYDLYMDDLRNDELPDDVKKKILLKLASSKEVRAYRIIEMYLQNPSPSLVNWAYMALFESRLMLESDLTDERRIYISTGLGGKDNKLRFYLLILSADGTPFLDYQRQMIEREFSYFLTREECDIERLTVHDNYVELVVLTPLNARFRKALEDMLVECNQYGDFLDNSIGITNVKEFSPEEIKRIMKKTWGKNKK